MFLFDKRTKNIVKWFWAFFATIIIITMIVAYSGFAALPSAQAPQQQIPPDILAELEAQRDSGTTSPAVDAIMEQLSASGTVTTATPTIERTTNTTPAEPDTPPVPELQFGL